MMAKRTIDQLFLDGEDNDISFSSKKRREATEKSTNQQLNSNKKDNDDHSASGKRLEEADKLPTIFDGTYYKVISHDKENKSISAKCMKCIKEKIIRGQSTSTGNFYQHFWRSHREDHKIMKEYCDGKKTEKNVMSSNVQAQSVLQWVKSNGPLDTNRVIISNIFLRDVY